MKKKFELNLNQAEIPKEQKSDKLLKGEKIIVKTNDNNINKQIINKYDEIDNIPIQKSNLDFVQILEKELSKEKNTNKNKIMKSDKKEEAKFKYINKNKNKKEIEFKKPIQNKKYKYY